MRRDELELARHVHLTGERGSDLVERLELARPPRRLLVQAGVLDRDRRLRGEQRDHLLVVVVEIGAARLLAQVEVPVSDVAELHGHAQERPHGRMVRREAERARIVGEVVQAKQARVVDEHAEDAAAARRVADHGLRFRVETVDDEPLQTVSGAVDHAERRIAGAGQLRRRLDAGEPRTASSDNSEPMAMPASTSARRS